MTIDLWLLMAAMGWTWLLILAAATPSALGNMKWALGARDEPLEQAVWVGRLKRAAENMKENLPLYAIVVLVAHAAGKTNETTALAGEIFLAARVAHAFLYVMGVAVARTTAWVVSVAAMGMIAWALVG